MSVAPKKTLIVACILLGTVTTKDNPKNQTLFLPATVYYCKIRGLQFGTVCCKNYSLVAPATTSVNHPKITELLSQYHIF